MEEEKAQAAVQLAQATEEKAQVEEMLIKQKEVFVSVVTFFIVHRSSRNSYRM